MLQALGITAATLALPASAQADLLAWFKGNEPPKAPSGKPLTFTPSAAYHPDLALTPEDKVTGYNNFYEFGLDKADPAANAGTLKTEDWQIKIDGDVVKPMTLDMDYLMKCFPLEERIYRLRCVEAWSMVVPWIGFELGKLLKLAEPTSTPAMWRSKHCMLQIKCLGRKTALLAGDWTTPMSKGCGWMKPCTRWPLWLLACMAKPCHHKWCATTTHDTVEIWL